METKLNVEILAHTPNPDEIVAMGGKLCYSTSDIKGTQENLTDKEIKKFVNMLVKMGHESPLEHSTFTFGMEGVSRSLLAQITRHRIASYSVKSQRYVGENQFKFIIPKEIKNDTIAHKVFLDHMKNTQDVYNNITENLYEKYLNDGMGESQAEKKAIENARAVLPNACETKIIMTMNARNLLHFFNKRSCNRAQDEIRELSDKMLELVRGVAPSLFKFAGADCTYGKCGEGIMSCNSPRSDLRVI